MTRVAWITGGSAALCALLWIVALRKPASEDRTAQEARLPTDDAPGPNLATNTVPGAAAPPQAAEPAAPPSAVDQPSPSPSDAPAKPRRVSNASEPPRTNGPIEQLHALFKSAPRQSAATESEARIQKQFEAPDTPPGMLKSVQCRESVCRIELRWKEDRADGYMAGLMRAYYDLNMRSMATEALGEPDADGSRRVDVYFGAEPSPRKP